MVQTGSPSAAPKCGRSTEWMKPLLSKKSCDSAMLRDETSLSRWGSHDRHLEYVLEGEVYARDGARVFELQIVGAIGCVAPRTYLLTPQ